MDLFKPLEAEIDYLEPNQQNLIKKAFLYAKDLHQGQFRSSGEPYITHPVAVACIIAKMKLDHKAIISALLHDVIEDTPCTIDCIIEQFGNSVAEIVEGVSKLDKLKFRTRAEAQAENFRKMILAMTKDVRVVLIKLADRTHNMRTLDSLRYDKRKRIAKETLEIYTPLAHRLGMQYIKNELEDLCLKAIYPHRYKVIKMGVEMAKGMRGDLLSTICFEIQSNLEKSGIKAWVYGREKHLYSLYKKLLNKSQHFQSILDVYAFRVVVDSVDNCYRALGVLHSMYKPKANSIHDYIAVPKTNGYQSLHTSMIGHKGMPIDVHIRTEEMQQTAQFGVASYWQYQEEQNSVQQRVKKWFNSILELQQSAGNVAEFMENVKSDLFSDDIYVFTPKGRIVELPANSTAIDFAYAVHSDIGNECVSALVDHKPFPVSQPLTSGQTVEIVTEKGRSPSPSWLSFVVTSKARSSIRQALKNLQDINQVILEPKEQKLRQAIAVNVKNQAGSLANLTRIIANANGNVLAINSLTSTDNNFWVNLELEVEDEAHLQLIVRQLSDNKVVLTVKNYQLNKEV